MTRPSPRPVAPAPSTPSRPRAGLLHRRGRARRRLGRIGAGAAIALLVPLAVPAPAAQAETRPFASTSPFNVPIRSAPALDPASGAMVAQASRTGQVYANLYAYGIPIYSATAATPRYSVPCAMEGTWGPCPFNGHAMPIPAGARPSSGSDGAMVVVDPAGNTAGEYWQAVRTSTGWAASWGAINSLSGSGWGGGSTGAGASRLAGVIRVAEIEAGRIDHAVVLQTDNLCAQIVRPPGVKTDGESTRADCIPAGARLQLDPAIDVATLPGSTKAERAVARALQVYGGYVIDRAGTSMSMSFERAPDATASFPGAVYAQAGLSWDYYGMPRVPWHRLRVLKTWNG